MRIQIAASIVGLTVLMGSGAFGATTADIPTVTTQEDVVSACTQPGNADGCKAVVMRYVAYLKASGKGADEINRMVADTVLALAKGSAAFSVDLRAVVADAVQTISALVTDPRELQQVAAISQSVLAGSFANDTRVDNGTAASPA